MSTIEFNNHLISLLTRLEYYAFQLTTNREDAQDLIQETMLKALKNRDKFRANGNFKAWIYTIMKNTFINNYRKSQRFSQFYRNSGNDDFTALDQKKGMPTPQENLQFNELNNIIEGLEHNYRQPFKLYNQGYKYEEIADRLKMPIGTVKSRIFLARKKLMFTVKND